MKSHRNVTPRQEALAERNLYTALAALQSAEECRAFQRDLCTPAEIQEFTSKLEYFRTLVGVGGTLTDELLIAAIQQTCRVHGNAGRACFIHAGKELARLFRDDYDRLESILRRVTI